MFWLLVFIAFVWFVIYCALEEVSSAALAKQAHKKYHADKAAGIEPEWAREQRERREAMQKWCDARRA